MAPVVAGSAEGGILKLAGHELRTERSVKDQDTAGERFEVGRDHDVPFGIGNRKYTAIVYEMLNSP
jgi:hypothetical protein